MILIQFEQHFTVKEISDSAKTHLLIPQGKDTVLKKSLWDVNVNISKNVYFMLICFFFLF